MSSLVIKVTQMDLFDVRSGHSIFFNWMWLACSVNLLCQHWSERVRGDLNIHAIKERPFASVANSANPKWQTQGENSVASHMVTQCVFPLVTPRFYCHNPPKHLQ